MVSGLLEYWFPEALHDGLSLGLNQNPSITGKPAGPTEPQSPQYH